ncbi:MULTISPECIES: M20/M25/M40 family metallo-hydrolase [unclassified Rathayibacter]|uniref:M20/M25/M40 family metallo-hydrolase n=1 Tax=unclassified Rathayibacter TaxID=2609250 RepID=UPI00188B08AE|nr:MULTISPECIES: M20/M25/M40 family metallo-hydrolase [unclassified Rathayibacter]MBF4461992.1 M20/M25/M40 family metallo-hydrolase [Rathayibacter sp. VKM Ac-2879]MBF4503965.1 M20/M25/M40 family metallo-hydrolase [Rathayibacter sp. VKM Ac-2878]
MTTTALERFQALLRVETVSHSDEAATDWSRFTAFAQLLEELYPALHGALERESVAGHSLLWRWRGEEPGEPSVLMAHHDVVSVTAVEWSHPPFAADTVVGADGRTSVIGRGALDDKGSLVALLEAVEAAVRRGERPRHDVYLVSTHNEETAGDGAPSIVSLLDARGIRPRFVLDEGGNVRRGIVPGVSTPIAVVGVTERGIMNLEIVCRDAGGHASAPPPPPGLLATQRLARAIHRLTENPFPSTLPEPIAELVRAAAPHADPAHAVWYREPRTHPDAVIAALAAHSNRSAAMLRTTVAITELRGSTGANVLASTASATANVRINPGDTVAGVVERIRAVIDDAEVDVRVRIAHEPSPVSPTGEQGDGGPYDVLRDVVHEVFPEAIVAPYVQTGGSDARHFHAISDGVYRFIPFEISPRQQLGIHGVDESIEVDQFERAIVFYERLLRRL